VASGPGRFKEPTLLVLLSLLAGPRHGYAIADDIDRLTGARPGPGTLYGAIDRLLGAALIVEAPSSGRRQPYVLTTNGRKVVEQELAVLSSVVRLGRRRLHKPGSATGSA
jgi:DNA-binding PadR family transcriptional regulator